MSTVFEIAADLAENGGERATPALNTTQDEVDVWVAQVVEAGLPVNYALVVVAHRVTARKCGCPSCSCRERQLARGRELAGF